MNQQTSGCSPPLFFPSYSPTESHSTEVSHSIVQTSNPGSSTPPPQPSISLFWLMRLFNWTMLGACKMLFVYSSEQTNKHKPTTKCGSLKNRLIIVVWRRNNLPIHTLLYPLPLYICLCVHVNKMLFILMTLICTGYCMVCTVNEILLLTSNLF